MPSHQESTFVWLFPLEILLSCLFLGTDGWASFPFEAELVVPGKEGRKTRDLWRSCAWPVALVTCGIWGFLVPCRPRPRPRTMNTPVGSNTLDDLLD